jgi:DinB superfamily
MTSSEFDRVFSQLETTPRLLKTVLSEMPAELIAAHGSKGGFSAIEQAWHMADLESEGFGPRISRLVSETEPDLPDFDGASIARERRYQEKSLVEGLSRFEAARAQNLDRLRRVTEPQWGRFGTQEGVGKVTLSDLPKMMLEHDRSHLRELVDLFEEIRPTASALAQLQAALSE